MAATIADLDPKTAFTPDKREAGGRCGYFKNGAAKRNFQRRLARRIANEGIGTREADAIDLCALRRASSLAAVLSLSDIPRVMTTTGMSP